MNPATSPALPSATRSLTGRAVWAGMLGNVLEWYDFGLYGLLAPVLATTFFPAHNRIAALMGAYGGFAAGFAMRPIGAAVLGRLGDVIGRRHLLALSVLLMGGATLAMGLLPSYARLGLWATGMLVAIRLLQGFSVGGEFVGSVTYLVESAPERRRGLAGSVSNLGATVGLLLAALLAAWALGSRAAWAWRATFWLGGALALAALLLRRGLPELPGTGARAPLRSAWRGSRRTMLLIVVFTAGYGIVNYLAMVLLPTFAHEFGHVSMAAALRSNAAGQALALVLVPLAGWTTDRLWRRRSLLLAAFAGEAALAIPAFLWARQPGLAGVWTAQLLLAGALALIMGAAPALLAEQFPAAYRVSAHAVAFNLGIGIAGGTAPLLALGLIRWSGHPTSAGIYLVFGAGLAVAALLGLHDRSREELL